MSSQASESVVQLTAFRVGQEEYVVDILRVQEIIRPLPVTPVRHGPRYVRGVINLRGSVIPIIDMRERFGLQVHEGSRERIMILSVEGRTVGLVVDQVTEVVRVHRHAIKPAPGMFDGGKAPFFLGVCEYKGRALILLNVKNIIASDDDIEPLELDAVPQQNPGYGEEGVSR